MEGFPKKSIRPELIAAALAVTSLPSDTPKTVNISPVTSTKVEQVLARPVEKPPQSYARLLISGSLYIMRVLTF